VPRSAPCRCPVTWHRTGRGVGGWGEEEGEGSSWGKGRVRERKMVSRGTPASADHAPCGDQKWEEGQRLEVGRKAGEREGRPDFGVGGGGTYGEEEAVSPGHLDHRQLQRHTRILWAMRGGTRTTGSEGCGTG
jgi:hypothetical protein